MRLGLIVSFDVPPFVITTPDPSNTEHDKLVLRADRSGKLAVYTEDAFGQEYPIAFYSEDTGMWERGNKSYEKMVIVS